MRRGICALTLSVACALLCFNAQEGPGFKNLPRLPGARLLVGYPPSYLKVVAPDSTWTLAEAKGKAFFLSIDPSMSRDGTLIAATLIKDDGVPRSTPLMSIATYSVLEEKWTECQTEYKGVQNFGGRVAIAPDGSKLAFAVHEPPNRSRVLVHIIDLKTQAERIIPAIGHHGAITLSWSPDGRNIVYDTRPKLPSEGATEYSPELQILDVETGKSKKIANGLRPAWSPSGEWIAYLDSPDASRVARWLFIPPAPSRLLLVRPDGTGSKLLLKLRGDFGFPRPPVWSPDSKTILLNEWRDIDKATMDLYFLDLSTLKLTRKFEGTPPVYDWAKAN